ncbi:uncharacterized protein LOC129602665 [Paramacrobiotus metropolitanus]|uniref:uncharacterized protein LOC129602665 n=1 Tax=Paramacrobiotus metropolitanus TaxID=2943436 RepID=UPI00244580C0|nr:uncharacterized protein LOC129602665 [Paramacrobiotus metropolitanus]
MQAHCFYLNMGIVTKSFDVEKSNATLSNNAPEQKRDVPAKRYSLRVSLKKDWESNLERALLRSLCVARQQFRIRMGLAQCLRILEFDARTVSICILPINEHNTDSLSHVQILLIEAYCSENKIPLLKVHSPENLWNIVKYNNETDIEDEEGGFEDEDEESDDGIVLILASQYESPEDDLLHSAYEIAAAETNSHPIVRLASG